MLPNPSVLIEKLEMTHPLMSVYDAPDPALFEPLVKPKPGRHMCVYHSYKQWLNGKTLHLTADNFGCGGCGRAMFNVLARERDEYLTFLAEEEGLKDSKELMAQWVDNDCPYQPEHGNIFIGPFNPSNESLFEYAKTIVFFVNADQLSVLMVGAQYHSAPGDVPPVIAPFGAGCMQVLPLFENLDAPQSMIGATDLAMRGSIPAELLTFTVTIPMYRRLCRLDERSFLFKPFLGDLKKARGKKGIGT